MDITDFREAIPAKREVPHAIIVAIALFEQMRPLLARQARKMFRLALTIMRLYDAAEPIGLGVKLVGVAALVRLDLHEVLARDADFIDRPLPSVSPPTFKILVHAL